MIAPSSLPSTARSNVVGCPQSGHTAVTLLFWKSGFIWPDSSVGSLPHEAHWARSLRYRKCSGMLWDMGCATARRATLAKSPSTIRIPAANQAAIIPTPCQPGFQGIPILPGTRRRDQEDGSSWYFRGAPLVLDVFPGTSRAGRDLEGREVHPEHQGARRPRDRQSGERPRGPVNCPKSPQ
jgi:hypothetical protein